MIKNIIKFILKRLSRFIYLIYKIIDFTIPKELKSKSKLKLKLENNLTDETFNHFKEHFKKSVIFNDRWKIREYAIQSSILNDKNKEYYYLEFGVWKGDSANFFLNL